MGINVPDYVVNAGGVISGGMELFGWSEEDVRARVEAICATTTSVLERALADRVAPSRAAARLAEEGLRSSRDREPVVSA